MRSHDILDAPCGALSCLAQWRRQSERAPEPSDFPDEATRPAAARWSGAGARRMVAVAVSSPNAAAAGTRASGSEWLAGHAARRADCRSRRQPVRARTCRRATPRRNTAAGSVGPGAAGHRRRRRRCATRRGGRPPARRRRPRATAGTGPDRRRGPHAAGHDAHQRGRSLRARHAGGAGTALRAVLHLREPHAAAQRSVSPARRRMARARHLRAAARNDDPRARHRAGPGPHPGAPGPGAHRSRDVVRRRGAAGAARPRGRAARHHRRQWLLRDPPRAEPRHRLDLGERARLRASHAQ